MNHSLSCHGGNIREAVEKYGLSPEKFLDFSANINPLGLSPKTFDIITSKIDSLINYPDPECKILKGELSDFLGVGSSNLLVGNGSIELIYLVPRAVLPKQALIYIPTFSEYELSVKASKCKAIFLKGEYGDGFKMKVDKLIKLLPKIDLVFICNPNNPTGNLIPKEEIIYLAKNCRNKGPILIIDEVFMDFVSGKGNFTVVKEAIRSNNLLVLGSLTKFFALPGLRLGYLIGNKVLISKLARYQFPWNVNSLAQLVGCEIIRDKSYIGRTKKIIMNERSYLFESLSRIKGLNPYDPTANFIFCRLNSRQLDSKALTYKLGTRGMLIRDCSNFRGLDERYIRIAVRKREENERLITELQKILGRKVDY